MSTFFVPVVRIGKTGKNPNSDSLGIWNGPQGPVQFKLGTVNEGDLLAFVPADSLVPVGREPFAFLAEDAKEGYARVRGVKLRGLPSVGLLVSLPVGHHLSEGDDAAAALGVKKYEPPRTHSFHTDGCAASPPSDCADLPTYDIENTWLLNGLMVEGSGVRIDEFATKWALTEKVHGCNGKFFRDASGAVHVGSRARWLKEFDDAGRTSVWWQAYRRHQKVLDAYFDLRPGDAVFGEVFGKVQDLHYGETEVDLRLFDSFGTAERRFWAPSRLMSGLMQIEDGLKLFVPLLEVFGGPYKLALERARAYLPGKSRIDGRTMMEGVVVRPAHEDLFVYGAVLSRLITKVISPEYLGRHGGSEAQ